MVYGVLERVIAIMDAFAADTGLMPASRPPRRYLWTDAFAVCNFLELHCQTREERFLHLATALVDQVHRTLGRHRPDDARHGWISGLDETQGARHPTAGGLRIGKPLPERRIGDAYDPSREWDRDGQYYHYLTKWMHALGRMAAVTGDADYRRWATELAIAAERGFVHTSSGGGRVLFWKMSIDLSRPQVAASGQHDALDGLITCLSLQAHRSPQQDGPAQALQEAIGELTDLCRHRDWFSDDPLGIGGLLVDAWRLVQLLALGHASIAERLLPEVVAAAARGATGFLESPTLALPASRRLAFREFGFSIGLHAAEKMLNAAQLAREQRAALEPLRSTLDSARSIENFWWSRRSVRAPSWDDHRDINDVMLATSLLPDAFLTI